jgi:hypothetical protein
MRHAIEVLRIGICRGCRGHFRKLTDTDDLCSTCQMWNSALRALALASSTLCRLRP